MYFRYSVETAIAVQLWTTFFPNQEKHATSGLFQRQLHTKSTVAWDGLYLELTSLGRKFENVKKPALITTYLLTRPFSQQAKDSNTSFS